MSQRTANRPARAWAFTPISVEEWITQTRAANLEITVTELRKKLASALAAYQANERCENCGQAIWVCGTAMVGWLACFSCITGEADPSDDFEIDSACDKS